MPDVVEVDGSMTVDDLDESLDRHRPCSRSRTMAGLVFEVLGRCPGEGDRVELGPVELEVRRMARIRVGRVRAKVPPTAVRSDDWKARR